MKMSLERNNMPFLTIDQLIAVIEKQRCFRCEKPATYFPMDKGIAYCDDHYPLKHQPDCDDNCSHKSI